MYYGYCRVSKPNQSNERQKMILYQNYPDISIVEEVSSGNVLGKRQELLYLLSKLKENDTLVVDEISRLSRNKTHGIMLYNYLLKKHINFISIKEPNLNSYYYQNVPKEIVLEIIGVAFDRAQKEREYISQRTKEGIAKAKLEGKRIGNSKGDKLITKKSIISKEFIKKNNKDFGGKLNNNECIKQLNISRNTFYKYKKELKEELL